MLPFVTIDTADAAMIGFGLGQSVALLLMTGATETGWKITVKDNPQRLVGGVTLKAVCRQLVLLVRFVAVAAAGNLFVTTVAAGAEQLGMPTR